MTDTLRTTNLSKRFGKTEALDHLNMVVPEHSVYALVGPNGAGKTTAIKILMNACQPTDGSAEVLGRDSRKLSPADFAEIGYVAEDQQMPEWMTVEYFMNYLKPFYPGWDVGHAQELLRQFELPPDRKIRNLSHGMRMKAALASSLSYRPKLIVLDEPFTGLDAFVRDELIEGVLECAEGATILMSSHDLSEVESFATHIGYLEHGHLQFSEDLTSLLDRFREVEITLANPSPSPIAWPAAWMNPKNSGLAIHFVDTQYDPERCIAEIHRLFVNTQQIKVKPMPLRAIFVTLAKAGRKVV